MINWEKLFVTILTNIIDILVVSVPIMIIWNANVAVIFGVSRLGYWDTVNIIGGLSILYSTITFKTHHDD